MSEDSRRASNESIDKEPLVSVVIPVYNVSRYLQQCLDSVVSQTYRNLEIIIVDDGSTDDSGSICDLYEKRDERIHVIHSANRGLSSARNLGLEEIRGAYILFVDSDDWIELHTLDTLIRAAMQTGADIVAAKKCSEYIGKTVTYKARTKCTRSYSGRDILNALAEGLLGNMAWNKLYRAECFTDIRFPDGRNYEDVPVTWKLMKNLAGNGGMVTELPDVLFHFRERKDSITHTWNLHNNRDCWAAHRTRYEALPDFQEQFLPGCFISIGHMWMSYSSYSKEEKAEAEETIREMNSFSKKNFHRVMRGSYPAATKLACLLSQSKRAPSMWIGFCVNRLRQILSHEKRIMFD